MRIALCGYDGEHDMPASQGDLLAREVIAIAERASKKAALWEELADQRALEIAQKK